MARLENGRPVLWSVLVAAFLLALATVGAGLPLPGSLAIALVLGGATYLGMRMTATTQTGHALSHHQDLARMNQTIDAIRSMQRGGGPAAMTDLIQEALASATNAHASATALARAADQVAQAIAELSPDGGSTGAAAAAVDRLRHREAELRSRLRSAADAVGEVYGALVETAATFATSGLTNDGDNHDLKTVRHSLEDLRVALQELDSTPGPTGIADPSDTAQTQDNREEPPAPHQ